MFWMFLAICWACAWCFDHNRPDLAILIGCLFGGFYLIYRWQNKKYPTDDYEDELDDDL